MSLHGDWFGAARGCALIDPHGDLAERVRARVPEGGCGGGDCEGA